MRLGATKSLLTRNYDAFTFEVKKRYSKGWLLFGSYTYSRMRGNYDGFVDPNTGAILDNRGSLITGMFQCCQFFLLSVQDLLKFGNLFSVRHEINPGPASG